MIKRFENFNNDIKVEDFIDTFAEFIDKGLDYEYDNSYFEIFIFVPILFSVNFTKKQDIKYNDINFYINKSKEQLDVFEDINVCIKRIFDKYKIYPNIIEEDGGNGFLLLNIQYEFNK